MYEIRAVVLSTFCAWWCAVYTFFGLMVRIQNLSASLQATPQQNKML
jgi:hypothetical protein